MRRFRSGVVARIALATALGLCLSCGGQAVAPSSDAGSDGQPSSYATDGHGPPFPCVHPTAVVVGGKDTGYDACEGGNLRRRAIVDCPDLLPRASKGACSLQPGDSGSPGSSGECSSDSDCTTQPLGLCGLQNGRCACSYGCVRDADCGSGDICVCGDPVGHCESATCNAGTCATGLECAEYPVNPDCGGNAFACQTASDECLSNADCAFPACGCAPGQLSCNRPSCTCTIVSGSSGPRTCSTQLCQQ